MLTMKLLVTSLFTLVLGKPLGRRTMKVHESLSEVPNGFTKAGAAPADTKLNLRIALAQSDSEGLKDALMAVSDPGSPQYRQYLTQDEVCGHDL